MAGRGSKQARRPGHRRGPSGLDGNASRLDGHEVTDGVGVGLGRRDERARCGTPQQDSRIWKRTPCGTRLSLLPGKLHVLLEDVLLVVSPVVIAGIAGVGRLGSTPRIVEAFLNQVGSACGVSRSAIAPWWSTSVWLTSSRGAQDGLGREFSYRFIHAGHSGTWVRGSGGVEEWVGRRVRIELGELDDRGLILDPMDTSARTPRRR